MQWMRTAMGLTLGEGRRNIGGRNYAFYVVDATRLKMIVTDFPSLLVGDAFGQQNVAFNVGSIERRICVFCWAGRARLDRSPPQEGSRRTAGEI
jgi:hypothetical protein